MQHTHDVTLVKQLQSLSVFGNTAGLNGKSSMRLVDLETGNVLKKTSLDRQWFGEGSTRLGDKLYQITWLTNQGFIYSVPDLQQVSGEPFSST